MKKNDLIKLLENIKGNPDVVLWNPYVEDYNPIFGVQTDTLYKESVSFIEDWLKAEIYQKEKRWELTEEELKSIELKAKQIHKNKKYDQPNPYVLDAEKDRWYQKRTKKIIVISPKKTGKVSYGRSSKQDIEY